MEIGTVVIVGNELFLRNIESTDFFSFPLFQKDWFGGEVKEF